MTASTSTRRLLVIANESCTGEELLREIRERADGAEVLIVAPALVSRLAYWLSDEDGGMAAAGERLQASVERCAAGGVVAKGAVGDADPLQALDDAVRTFAPDEAIIATRPAERSNWLEQGLIEQARARFPELTITHVVVDAAADRARVASHTPPPDRAPARERHQRRDLALLAITGILAIVGSLFSFIFYAVDAPEPLIWTWVIVFDLGFKLIAMATLWVFFQRRPRADRLDL